MASRSVAAEPAEQLLGAVGEEHAADGRAEEGDAELHGSILPGRVPLRERLPGPRSGLTPGGEEALEPERERLAREVVADVEREPRAGVVDQLGGGVQDGQAAPLRVGRPARRRGRRGGRARARPAATQARSRYHRPASCRPWSSAAVCARRSARRACSPASVSRRLCSLRGRNWSSSASRSSCAARAAAPRAARGLEQREPRAARRPCGRRAARGRTPRRGRAARGRRPAPARARAPRRRATGGRRRWPARAPCPGARGGRRARRATGASKRTGWQREAIVGSTCVEPVGQQQQHDVVRRLLQRLEQRVGGLVVHGVGALEHEDAEARLERRARRGGDDRLVDVAPQHLVGAARAHPGQVGVRAVLGARARARGIRGAAGEQLGRDRAGGRALAAPGRAVQQVRVRGAPVGGGAEHGGRVRMGLERGEGRHGLSVPSPQAPQAGAPPRPRTHRSLRLRRAPRPPDHRRGPRRRRQDDARDGAGGRAARARARRSRSCASRAASRPPSGSARWSRTRR